MYFFQFRENGTNITDWTHAIVAKNQHVLVQLRIKKWQLDNFKQTLQDPYPRHIHDENKHMQYTDIFFQSAEVQNLINGF